MAIAALEGRQARVLRKADRTCRRPTPSGWSKRPRRAGKQLMIGQVLPFFPEYAFAYASGRGAANMARLLGGHFKRVISDPLWLKDFYDPHKVGGPMLDLHVHDAHFIRLLCGMPRAVFSIGPHARRSGRIFHVAIHVRGPQLVVSAESGVIQQQGRGFCCGL